MTGTTATGPVELEDAARVGSPDQVLSDDQVRKFPQAGEVLFRLP
jgi:hypothetical protein